jgi:hypothetical protein
MDDEVVRVPITGEERARSMERLIDLRRQVDQHPANDLSKHWRAGGRSYDIFARNFQELVGVLNAARGEDLAVELFQNVRPPLVREQYFAEVDQRLHNFVASAQSLVEHTRNMIRRRYAEGSELRTLYEQRVRATFPNSPVAMFVQDLRDYTLHKELPVPGTTVTMSAATPPTAELRLETGRLLAWKRGWSPPAKTYLEAAGEYVVLVDAVTEYGRLVEKFYAWLDAERRRVHADELAAFESLVAAHNDLFERLRPTEPPGS